MQFLCQIPARVAHACAGKLTLDFAGSVKVGDWVETRVDIQKLGRRMAFANAYLSVYGERVVRASAVFLVAERAITSGDGGK